MHARNPYNDPPDFAALAHAYKPLRAHIIQTATGAASIDFKDPVAQRRLTEALLHRDFGLTLTLPEGRLCPPVPNRLNYVLWIQDLLDATPCSSKNVIGIDIGTGASAIYALLACTLRPSWSFIGTEIDHVSADSARANVEANGLTSHIKIVKTTSADPILCPFHESPNTFFDFTMCNPPFYASAHEVERSSEGKLDAPNAVCTGSETEMITHGGEASFVCQMVEESLSFHDCCRWFTSMLGKHASVAAVVSALRAHKIDNYAVTELVQGKTRRWALAWSFLDARLPDKLARATAQSLQAYVPLSNTLRQAYPCARAKEDLANALRGVLATLDEVSVQADNIEGPSRFSVSATRNSWSRGARRKRKRDADSEQGAALPQSSTTPILECCITAIKVPAKPSSGDPNLDSGWSFECTWVRGRERALFEGFWSSVSRKVYALVSDLGHVGRDVA